MHRNPDPKLVAIHLDLELARSCGSYGHTHTLELCHHNRLESRNGCPSLLPKPSEHTSPAPAEELLGPRGRWIQNGSVHGPSTCGSSGGDGAGRHVGEHGVFGREGVIDVVVVIRSRPSGLTAQAADRVRAPHPAAPDSRLRIAARRKDHLHRS